VPNDSDRELRAATDQVEIVGWVREQGETKREALLLHGGPGLTEYLTPLATELDGLMTMARYQQRGLAPSAVGGDVSVEGHVADAIQVVDELGWKRPVLIGHSWGGYLAMHLAAAHQGKIGALVIIDSLGAVDRGGQREFVPNLRRGLTSDQLARLDQLEQLDTPTQDDWREHLGILWPNYFGSPASAPPMPYTEFATNSDETWASIQGHFRRGTLARRLPRVSVPTLVIHGELSPIPVIHAERVAQLIPGARLVVVPGVGHLPWLERPGTVRGHIATFIESLP